MRNNWTRYVYWLVVALLLIGLAWQFAPSIIKYVNYARMALGFNHALDYGEGPLLDQTMRLSKFENIYHNDLSKPPYTIANYPPLFMLAQVPFAWIFGPALWYGRAIDLLSVLLTALFIFLTLRALTRDWIGSAVGGLVLLIIPYIQHWSLYNRIDELALVLSWAALFATVQTFGYRLLPSLSVKETALCVIRQKGFWVAVALFVASVYTRQTYLLAAPVAAFAWLVFGSAGGWKQRLVKAVLLGVAVGGVVLVLFLLLDLITWGGFFLNIITANVNTFFWDTVKHYRDEIKDHFWPMLWMAGIYAAFEVIQGIILLALWIAHRSQRKNEAAPSVPATKPVSAAPPGWRRSAWALVIPYAIAATAGSITIGKDGSNVNYLLEFSAALAITSGAALAWAWQWQRWWVRLIIQIPIIGLLAYQANTLVGWAYDSFGKDTESRVADVETLDTVQAIIRKTPGIVIADEYMAEIPLAGKQLYFQPFEFKQLAQGKVWDEQPFLQDIAAKKFDLIIWFVPPYWPAIDSRYTPAQKQSILINYEMDEHFGYIYIYRPFNK